MSSDRAYQQNKQSYQHIMFNNDCHINKIWIGKDMIQYNEMCLVLVRLGYCIFHILFFLLKIINQNKKMYNLIDIAILIGSQKHCLSTIDSMDPIYILKNNNSFLIQN